MLVCQLCHHTSARGALDETLHNEERLVDFLYGTSVLTNSCSDSGNAHRSTAELVDNGQQDAVVYLVQSVLVDIQRLQGYLGDAGVNLSRSLHLGEVADASQQGIGNTGRTSRTTGNLVGSISSNRYAQDRGRSFDDSLQGCRVVILVGLQDHNIADAC